MHNWSVDEKQLATYPQQHAIWRLEQMVNFGLDGDMLSIKDLKTYWSRLVLDPKKKEYLAFLLWNTVPETRS